MLRGKSVSKVPRWFGMYKLGLMAFMVLALLPISMAFSSSVGVYSPQVKVYSSYDLIHQGQLLFPDAWHPKPLKLYYDAKFIPAISRNYEIRLPYVLPSSYKTSCQMFKHDGYYFVTTDIHCYG